MKKKDSFLLRLIISVIGVCTLVGLLLLFADRDFKEPSTSVELLVFMMSSTALILAVIQGFAIERQMKEIKKSSLKISDTAKDLNKLLNTEEIQNNLLGRDLELDEILVRVLSEQGMEVNHKSAREIRKKFQKKS